MGGGRTNAPTPDRSLGVTRRLVSTRVLLALVLVGPVLVRLAGAVGVPRQTGVVVVVLGAVTLTGARVDAPARAGRPLGAAVAATVHGRAAVVAAVALLLVHRGGEHGVLLAALAAEVLLPVATGVHTHGHCGLFLCGRSISVNRIVFRKSLRLKTKLALHRRP